MIKKMFLFVFGLVVINTIALAQTQVTGKVTDEKGSPIVKATITEKGTKNSVITDNEGNFKLKLSKSSSLIIIISSIGFQGMEVNINNANNIILKQSKESLEEVIVTGYSNERKSKYSGASTRISAKTFEDVPNGSFTQSLQGRLPGVLVNSGSGQPGSSPRVQIRGVNSISGAFVQPLYIIDGVPYNSNDFQSLNANDFDDVTVLKDADAVSLYGSRGANGVIVISTKRGKSGIINVLYRTQYGVTQKPDFSQLNLMSSAEFLDYEKRNKIAGSPGYIWSDSLPGYNNRTQNAKDSLASLLNKFRNNNLDFTDLFYRQGISKNNEIQFSGGTDKTRFFTSLGYFDQEGIDQASYLKRYSARFNIDHNENNLILNFNNLIAYTDMGLADGEYRGNSALNPFQLTYRALPYQNPYNLDGSLNWGPSTQTLQRVIANSLEARNNTVQTLRQLKINSGFSVTYKITKNLFIKNTSGVDYSSSTFLRFINPNSYRGTLEFQGAGIDQEGQSNNSNLINTFNINYSNIFKNDHALTVNAFYELIKGYNKSLGFLLYNLDKRLTETGIAAYDIPTTGLTTYPQRASSSKSQFGLRSYFASVKYTYLEKYTLNFTIRRDGTSRILKPENKEITSTSYGFVWNAIKEKFISNILAIDDLKFRTSFGVTPNISSIPVSISANSSGLISIVPFYLGAQLPTYSTTNYTGSTISGIIPGSSGYEDLKIENVQQFNIGFDISLFKSRVNLSLDYYSKLSKDLYILQSLSATSGFASQNINAGSMTNKGFDILLKLQIIKTKDFQFNINWNHNINNNSIGSLNNPDPEFQYVSGTYLIKEGLPLGSHYTYDYRGAEISTGKPTYRASTAYITDPITLRRSYNKAGDTLVNDIAKAGQFATFGSWLPVHTGGLEFVFKYKNFSLSALFSYQADVVRSNNIRNWITRNTYGYATAVRQSRELIGNTWEKPGDVKWFPKFDQDKGFTSADLEDASFVRFRNLDISYTFNNFKKFNHIKSIRVYLQAQNLIFWTKFSGLDPEDDNNISLNEYPNPKFYNFGLDINF